MLCPPVIAREAREQGKSLAAHYAHLVVHGVLHLHGYDHEKTRDARRMEAREARMLRRLGFPDPYAVKSALPSDERSFPDPACSSACRRCILREPEDREQLVELLRSAHRATCSTPTRCR